MGGHGGLNILPQKRWNVYNYDNREKVRKDEEAAAKEEQLKQQQSRRRDMELRIDRLRQARGVAGTAAPKSPPSSPKSDAIHINLFEGGEGFSALAGVKIVRKEVREERNLKRKREEAAPAVVTAEDEKYRMGYGLAGKGVKKPWYMEKPVGEVVEEEEREDRRGEGKEKSRDGKKKKKSIQELREERIKREMHEKERERMVLAAAMRTERRSSAFIGGHDRNRRSQFDR